MKRQLAGGYGLDVYSDPMASVTWITAKSPKGSVAVLLDSFEENMVTALALHAQAVLPDTWNGWARPVATAAAMQDFLDRWRRNDPNGTWGHVVEEEGALVYQGADDDEPESFEAVGFSDTGETLYDLSGWTWVKSGV